MIFVSIGTGFAPMRAFLWERAALKRAGVSLAEAALFNGIRSSTLDYIYRDEIEQFAAEGVLNHVHVATSREPPGSREYVQDRIRAQGALVWRLLDAGGYVYVCGSQPMRGAVRAALIDVVTEHGSLPREHAEAYLQEGRCDLVALAREMMWDPNWPVHAAQALGADPLALLPPTYAWWLRRRDEVRRLTAGEGKS